MKRFTLSRHHLQQLFQKTFSEHFEDRCPQLAAAVSYYTLFALFPLVILGAGAFGLIQGEAEARQNVIDLVNEYVVLTDDGQDALEEALQGAANNSGVYGLVGIIGLIFSASGVMGAIRNALNAAFDIDSRRPPVHGKLIDISLVLLVGLIAACSLAITLVGRLAPDLGDGEFLMDAFYRGVPIGLNFAIFALLYYLLPATQVRLRDIWPGALFAALGYEAAKHGFAFYLTNFGNYSAVYGSVAAIIVFMLFVYIAANIFLLGAEMASEWPRVKSGKYDKADEDDESERLSELPPRERARVLARKFIFRNGP